MQSPDFEDRRLFARFLVNLPVKYLYHRDLKTEGQGMAQNICAAGLCLESNEKLLPHTLLYIRFDVPVAEELPHYAAEVVWVKTIASNKFRAGIKLEEPQFIGISRVLSANLASQPS